MKASTPILALICWTKNNLNHDLKDNKHRHLSIMEILFFPDLPT
jgi:hypothetical protein